MSRSRNEAAARNAVPVFAALADETRLTIVTRLCGEGPLSIAELTEGTSVTRQAITKHLVTLADAGLVKDTWRGRERLWKLEAERLEVARQYIDRISAQWDAAIERLIRHVEKE